MECCAWAVMSMYLFMQKDQPFTADVLKLYLLQVLEVLASVVEVNQCILLFRKTAPFEA